MEQPELKVYELPTAQLVPYVNNAKIHDAEQVRQIERSIEQFGFNDPIAVWTNADGEPEIIEGHGRVMAAKNLGIGSVPVVYLDHLTDAQRRAYTHIHNQLTLNSGFDFEVLDADIAELPEFDWELFGFDIPLELQEDELSAEEDAFTGDEAVEQRCARGDVWMCGNHRVMCGDASSKADMEKLIGGGCPPVMCFTDPPYGVAIGDKNKMLDEVAGESGRIKDNIEGDTLPLDELYEMLKNAFTNLKAASSEECSYYVSSPQGGEIGLMMMMMRDAGLPVRHNLIWNKTSATFSMGRLDYDYKHEPIFYTWGKRHRFYGENKNTVLDFPKPRKCDLHPTMKPVELVAELMRNSSRVGDHVIDIFGGSETTLVAAEQLGRTAYIMEIDPHYCDVIIQRWEQLTGSAAVKAAV